MYIVGGIFIMAGHNTINPRYAFTNTAYSYTLIKKGPSMWNTEAVRLFPGRIIGKADFPLFLQSNYDGFLVHRNYLGEKYAIN